MGQAFDKDGQILGEMFGQTKREVFDKLSMAHPDAADIRIRTLRSEDTSGPSVQMTRWKCHKEVSAEKILHISDPTEPGNESDGSRILHFAGSFRRVDRHYVQKHQPAVGGYFVVYDGDFYQSYSPAKAFEDGYTKL